MKRLFYAGIDVDDKSFHVAVVCNLTNEITEFKCAPNPSSLFKKFTKLKIEKKDLMVCYEASYLGFSLYRELSEKGFVCEVIAPSLIPELPGKKQKTDKIDARKLAEFYMKGLLTAVHVPDLNEEMDRDLIRSRKFLAHQASRLKNHITSLCRTLGWNYRAETGRKSYWITSHFYWLDTKINSCKNLSLKVNLKLLTRQLEQTLENISLYDTEIENLSEQQKYAPKVKALNCYRGLNTPTSMALITELGDIHRFSSPTNLASYGGFDLIESSSGGKEHKYCISKDGNKHIRTAVIEACQFALAPPKASLQLKIRRREVDKNLVDIADRCMTRLHKKGTRLLYKGKNRNKIKVACAREMLGFIWETLKAVS